MRTLVVKVGSAVVAPGGVLSTDAVARLASDLAGARAAGVRTVLVSSGAVACGLSGLGLDRMPARLSDRQAAAAVGQPLLMRAWAEALEPLGVRTAQALLVADDIDFRARFVNAHRTLHTLLDRGVLPIINENDTVSFDEIRLGDNDRLSALAAGLVGADLLVMLSSADGVRTGGGRGEIIPEITDIAAARVHAGGAVSDVGTGGMITKLDAAQTAREMGTPVVIASGAEPGVLGRILNGEPVGTRFPAPAEGSLDTSGRKRWIAHSIRTRGTVTVDDGAARAIAQRGASLLPKGITAVEASDPGGFPIGAAVEVRTGAGERLARGLVSYGSGEIARIMGRRSDEIGSVLGYTYCDEVIHRDDLIVVNDRGGKGER